MSYVFDGLMRLQDRRFSDLRVHGDEADSNRRHPALPPSTPILGGKMGGTYRKKEKLRRPMIVDRKAVISRGWGGGEAM